MSIVYHLTLYNTIDNPIGCLLFSGNAFLCNNVRDNSHTIKHCVVITLVEFIHLSD